MKKASPRKPPPKRPRRPAAAAADALRPRYDFRGGVRGKYVARYRAGTNVIVLDPDVAARFPDAASVNRALRAVAELADGTPPKSRSRRRTA